MVSSDITKIAVIGNVCGGKTRMSRALSKLHQLPVTHVDSIQFLSGLRIRPYQDSITQILAVQGQEKWIIDGYGPLDIIEKRFKEADRILFIDLPLWRHYWWCMKRQITNLWSRRIELPDGCDERNFNHTVKLFKTIKQTHLKMRPELLRILQRDHLKPKTIIIHTLAEWENVFRSGLT